MRVLLANPDSAERRRLRKHFEGHGHRVDLARDGVEAWNQLRRALPDVVLTHVEMPHMGGTELTRTIRRNPATRELPVLLVGTPGGLCPAEATRGRDAADEIVTLAAPLDGDVVE